MSSTLKLIRSATVLVSLLALILLLAGCEISRPGGGADAPPSQTTPAAVVSPPATTEATMPPPESPVATVEPAPGETTTLPTVPAAGASGDLPEMGLPAPTPPPPEPVPGTVLVKLNPQASIQARSAELGGDGIVEADIPSLDQRLREIGASNLEPVIEQVADAIPDESLESLSVQAVEVSQLYKVNFSEDQDPQEVATKLEQDPTVEFAEPNYMAGIAVQPVSIALPELHPASRPAALTPNDPLYSFQWHLQTIQAPAAWDSSTGQQVIVGIVDTGVDFRASDLAGTARLPGYDFVNNDNDPTDDQGHGTHVAGTIAQTTNNGIGVAGVAYNARILPVKVLGANGQGSYENIIKGIIYAVDQGAKVINLSLAGSSGSQSLRDAVQYANSKGVTVVAAAGNHSGAVEFPAAYDEFVIGVGSVRFDLQRPSYSNFGAEVDVMAPGGDLSVDLNGDGYADGVLQQTFKTPGTFTYLFNEGTSMASPHVAGLAALLLARSPGLTPAMVENLMAQTAKPAGLTSENGAGVIQAAAALVALSGGPSPIITPTPTTPVATPTSTSTPSPTPLTPTPPPTPTFTTEPISEHGGDITVTPAPVCTPPACGPGEVYYCPGDCPGGCGTQCATPTPGVTPTTPAPITPVPITPTPPPTGELLLGGGFEADEGWVFGDTPIRGGYATDVKLGGSRAARVGNVSGPDIFSFSSVWQKVTIPAEAAQATLRVNVYPVSLDGPGSGDVQNIMILNERFQVAQTLSAELSNSRTWESRTYDLSEFRGRTIYIYFSVVNQGRTGKPTALYIDDVSLTWSR
ncbi:MAG: hypothetical protein DPW09_01115 [Anaerolineae bacterium]|nr:S8 family serine peptidase [Anaerolineales bacterium]MCQ3972024.1 hypothetical protein [Anaerolineae bacterium]